MAIFAKMRLVKSDFEGQEITWKRTGLAAGLRCETIMGEIQDVADSKELSDDEKLDAMKALFLGLLREIIKPHMVCVDGDPVEATAEELAEELNYEMIVRLAELLNKASKPTELEKKESPQP